MKKIGLAASIVLAAATALAQTEGVADYKISGESVNGTGRLYFSKVGYRVEWNMDVSRDAHRGAGGPREMKMTMFGKLSEPDVVYTLNDETKSWSTWNTKQAATRPRSRSRSTRSKAGGRQRGGLRVPERADQVLPRERHGGLRDEGARRARRVALGDESPARRRRVLDRGDAGGGRGRVPDPLGDEGRGAARERSRWR
jgi:hypothetical protein